MTFQAEQMNVADSTSGIDVDALMAEVNQSEPAEIPMTASDTPAPATETPQPAPTSTTTPGATGAQEFEFTWNGKQIKAPISDPRVKQWASQGYDYSQKMAEFSQKQAEIEKQAAWAREAEGRYKEIDEYVKQNPQFWDHVTQSWTNRQGQAPDPLEQKLQSYKSELKSEIGEIKEFIQAQRQAQQAAEQQEEDQRLNQEIKSIQEKYPDLDLNQVDESGKTLETKVLEFAVENGIRKFSVAFNAFNHDRLLKLHEEKGKEAAQKEIQKKTKLGLLGTTPTPTRGISQPKDIKNETYDSLYEQALEELRGA